MKNTIIGFIIGMFIGAIAALTLSYFAGDNIPAAEVHYIPLRGSSTDSITIVNLTEELRRTQDSLNVYKADTTISAELFVAKYKLERIRHYNAIAAKGNNIKYLRGWLNRVLNE